MTMTNLTLPSAASSAAGSNDLHDIKPPVDIPSGWAWVGWLLAALALGAVLLWLWRVWRQRRAQVPPVPVIPPHVRAKQRLEEALALLGQPREFCILVSDTIRQYLEERFDFHAPERTTEEFLYELKGTHILVRDQKESLALFLEKCDLVKFARYEPREAELRDLHAAALRLVEETEPEPVQPGVDGGHAGALQPASDPRDAMTK